MNCIQFNVLDDCLLARIPGHVESTFMIGPWLCQDDGLPTSILRMSCRILVYGEHGQLILTYHSLPVTQLICVAVFVPD